MPHSEGPRGPHRHRHSLASLAGASSSASLERALWYVVPDAADAAFIARCILGEGPAHHRAASWAILSIAAEIARRVGASPCTGAEDAVAVAMRLPPHLAPPDDGAFPIALPLEPLRAIVERERDVEAIADALVDGPPHHALANAALVGILGRILAALDTPGAKDNG